MPVDIGLDAQPLGEAAAVAPRRDRFADQLLKLGIARLAREHQPVVGGAHRAVRFDQRAAGAVGAQDAARAVEDEGAERQPVERVDHHLKLGLVAADAREERERLFEMRA